MQALGVHNVKEFSRILMKAPGARPTPSEVQQDADQQFVLYDRWLAPKVEAPPDWVVSAHRSHAQGR